MIKSLAELSAETTCACVTSLSAVADGKGGAGNKKKTANGRLTGHYLPSCP